MNLEKADILLVKKRLDFPPALQELYHYHCYYDRLEFPVSSFGLSFIRFSATCTWVSESAHQRTVHTVGKVRRPSSFSWRS